MEESVSTVPLAEIIGIIACIMLSAFFSGSETALTRITTSRSDLLIQKNPGKYGILKTWRANKKRILSALLVGNNLVNIMCSILAFQVANVYCGNYAEAVSVFGLTLIILIFAEITPKSIALQKAEKIVVPLLRVVWLVDKLLFLIAWPLSRIPGLIPGVRDEEPSITEDEIKYHIKQGLDKDVFEEETVGELLKSSVEFSNILTKEIMIPRTDIVGIEKDMPTNEAVQIVIRSGHSRLPVFEGDLDHIVGFLYAKDMLREIHNQGSENSIAVSGVLRGQPLVVPETQQISMLLTDMRRCGLHIGIVVDEFGGTAGLVTLEDIIEELVGEIRDEHDTDKEMIRKIDDGRWLVDARVSLNDLKDDLNIELPNTGDYETVGGFVVSETGRIPKRGKVIKIANHELIVVEVDERHVKHLEIRVIPEDKGDL